MAEHEPHGAPLDERALAEALDARPATIQHEAHGEGLQFSLGHGDARLEVYPRARVTRLVAPALRTRVELFDSTIAQVSPGGVEFSRTSPGQDASLTVVPSGGIVFTLVAGGERRPSAPPEPVADLADEVRAGAAFASGSGHVPAVRAPETPQELQSDTAGTSVPPPTVDGSETPQAAREPSLSAYHLTCRTTYDLTCRPGPGES